MESTEKSPEITKRRKNDSENYARQRNPAIHLKSMHQKSSISAQHVQWNKTTTTCKAKITTKLFVTIILDFRITTARPTNTNAQARDSEQNKSIHIHNYHLCMHTWRLRQEASCMWTSHVRLVQSGQQTRTSKLSATWPPVQLHELTCSCR